jgi:hypothetical protein
VDVIRDDSNPLFTKDVSTFGQGIKKITFSGIQIASYDAANKALNGFVKFSPKVGNIISIPLKIKITKFNTPTTVDECYSFSLLEMESGIENTCNELGGIYNSTSEVCEDLQDNWSDEAAKMACAESMGTLDAGAPCKHPNNGNDPCGTNNSCFVNGYTNLGVLSTCTVDCDKNTIYKFTYLDTEGTCGITCQGTCIDAARSRMPPHNRCGTRGFVSSVCIDSSRRYDWRNPDCTPVPNTAVPNTAVPNTAIPDTPIPNTPPTSSCDTTFPSPSLCLNQRTTVTNGCGDTRDIIGTEACTWRPRSGGEVGNKGCSYWRQPCATFGATRICRPASCANCTVDPIATICRPGVGPL